MTLLFFTQARVKATDTPRPAQCRQNRRQGFALIELAITLVILSILFTTLVIPLATQKHQQRNTQTQAQLNLVKEALMGHIAAWGYLPCPADDSDESNDGGGDKNCQRPHGFVPAQTLGLTGNRNDQGLLIDAWGNPLRYSVSLSDADNDGVQDWTRNGELMQIGPGTLQPELTVCASASQASKRCTNGDTLVNNIPAVVVSYGKHWNQARSEAEEENRDGPSVQVSGRRYAMPGDAVFVKRTQSNVQGKAFDDLVDWLSPMHIYARMQHQNRAPHREPLQ